MRVLLKSLVAWIITMLGVIDIIRYIYHSIRDPVSVELIMSQFNVILDTISISIIDSSLLVDVNWLPDISSLRKILSKLVKWSVHWVKIHHMIVRSNMSILLCERASKWLIILINSSTDAMVKFGAVCEVFNPSW